jgi:alpha-L-fucosidase
VGQAMRPGHIIEMLIDIVSKNGTMLLNILQRPGGSIDEETRYILNGLASWVPVCGEGIYGPGTCAGRGPSLQPELRRPHGEAAGTAPHSIHKLPGLGVRLIL